MSHTVTLTDIKVSLDSVVAAAEFLGYQFSPNKKVTFYDGRSVAGLAVQLPAWRREVVFGEDGQIQYDNYHGSWVDIKELNRFIGYTMMDMNHEDLSSVIVVDEKDGQIIFETR